MTVRLGFEVGSGAAVEIPIRNTAVTGQTQESGKTTTLEALVARSNVKALAFLTKRGETSFGTGRIIQPYFREQTDWEFVHALLEATRRERLRMERAWIIRATKGARTLAEVQRNVKTLMLKAKRGMDQDMYLTLDAYLEQVVPTIAKVQWAKSIDLAPGLNVMDLRDLPEQMHHLVIKSAMTWVLEHETATVVVVPEAWKFVPQGRGTPVKLAAVALIRQGSALKNYVWLDSQDIGGIDKEILRSVPVWILGVQREANEIKRTLTNIPEGTKKPRGGELAVLELGQFYACWGTHAIKTYVQPVWMSNETALAKARGEKGGRVDSATAERLTRENTDLRTENADLKRRLTALEDQSFTGAILPPVRPEHVVDTKPVDVHIETREGRIVKARMENTVPVASEPPADIYEQVKAKLLRELPSNPTLLRILASQPELEVQMVRTVIEVDGTSPKGRIARLVADGYFDSPRLQGQVRSELKRTSGDMNPGSIWRILKELIAEGFLTAEANKTYRATSAAKSRVRVEEVA